MERQLKEARTSLKKNNENLASFKEELEYYQSRAVKAEGEALADLEIKIADLNSMITTAQKAVDIANGMLAKADAAQKEALAKKEEMGAIDKMNSELEALYNQRTALDAQYFTIQAEEEKLQEGDDEG